MGIIEDKVNIVYANLMSLCAILSCVMIQPTSVTIINDCRDANAAGRQIARTVALLNAPTSLVGVASDIEAAGNLIDALDSYGDAEAVVLVNVAPRNGKAKKWKNGTPFGYFRYNNVLVVSTVDGCTLSLVKKLGIVNEVKVMDIPTVAPILAKANSITPLQEERLSVTQFRSFDFSPFVARYLLDYKDITHETLSLDEVPDAPQAIWWIDNFGNIKTTLLPEEVSESAQVETTIGSFKTYDHLKDVPNNEAALIVGSSGLLDTRFVEIVVQGKHAAEVLNVTTGTVLF